MMIIMPKYRVFIRRQSGAEHTFWVYAHNISSAMTSIQSISFTRDGLDENECVCISLEK